MVDYIKCYCYEWGGHISVKIRACGKVLFVTHKGKDKNHCPCVHRMICRRYSIILGIDEGHRTGMYELRTSPSKQIRLCWKLETFIPNKVLHSWRHRWRFSCESLGLLDLQSRSHRGLPEKQPFVRFNYTYMACWTIGQPTDYMWRVRGSKLNSPAEYSDVVLLWWLLAQRLLLQSLWCWVEV